jgi:deoxyribonuclease-1
MSLVFVLFTLWTLTCSPVFADQFQIPNLREAQPLFWDELYPEGGWTLYCGEPFNEPGRTGIESIYPMSWVMQHLQCGSLEQCRSENAKFNRIEADLHNMYPALERIIQARKDYRYGIIAGEYREFFECNFEYDVRDQLAEPRDIAKGNIARAIFYMHLEYELPIDANMLEMLVEWNRKDPPSKDELRRNDVIETLQGTRNPFIDNPNQGDRFLSPAPKTQALIPYRQASLPASADTNLM